MLIIIPLDSFDLDFFSFLFSLFLAPIEPLEANRRVNSSHVLKLVLLLLLVIKQLDFSERKKKV